MPKNKKLLFVAPHLSTGGMPQYLLRQIEEFIDDFNISVIEVNNHSGNAFVVQKNQINDLVKLYTLGDDKTEIENIIKDINPDIIHFHEVPEHFLPHPSLERIFGNQEREYKLVVTTHGSKTNPNEIRFHADKYILVSEWSRQQFEHLGIDTDVWEYPIDIKETDKVSARKHLGFEEDYKHVLMVGLFTPGKNQSEIFKLARQLEKYKIKFHFVGNQAGNFEHYWKPIMDNRPPNCIVWGERNDVDKFYEASDLFYFSSTLELNPLSVKEALGYKLPSIFRKLHTYLDTYDDNPLVTYITDDLLNTKQILINKLKPKFNEIPGWFSYEKTYKQMVNEFPSESTFVELGSWMGKSSNKMAELIKESNKNIKFVTIDSFNNSSEKIRQNIINDFDGDLYCEFIDNALISDNKNSFEVIKDTSENSVSLFENNSIDFMMIDSDYTSTKHNLNLWYHKIKPNGIIAGDDYNVFDEVNKSVNDFFYNQVAIDGYSYMRRKPRIQIKHLMTRPDDLRETISHSSLKQLERYGMVYEPIINEVYDKLPPKENCRRPEHLSKDNQPGELYPGAGLGWITGRHYGCYLAHRTALETIDTENFDYTLVFEADAYISSGLEEFASIIHKACFISERDKVPFISFANNGSQYKEKIDDLFTKTGHNQNLAHCYLIPNRDKSWWLDRLEDCGWDVGDLWFNHVFFEHPRPRYTTNKIYSMQADGFSLLDLYDKKWS
jgi:predicted O-methyltransferase YrrM